MKTNRKQTIKMVAHNPITRRYEEVFPEDEVTEAEMIPMFWCNSDNRWVTIPGTTVADVKAEWLKQVK